MATKFVNSGAAGTNDGSSWTNAWTSLASSSGVAAGDTVKVHKTHSESALAANINWSNGTTANPVIIACCDKDASDALSTGASVGWNTTLKGAQGNIYPDGITWTTSAATLIMTTAAGGRQQYKNCTFTCTGTGGLQFGDGGTNGFEIDWVNCNIDFSGASNASVTFFLPGVGGSQGYFTWNGGTYTPRATQTNLLSPTTVTTNVAWFNAINFSGTVTNLFNSGTTSKGQYYFSRCTAPTYTNVYATAPTSVAFIADLSGLTAGTLTTAQLQPTSLAEFAGTVKAVTARYRTGGAADGSQATSYSWELASNANAANVVSAIEAPPITRWVTAGSQTLTVYVASAGTLNNDTCWVEAFSPSEAVSATGQAKFQTTQMATLGSAAALTTDGTSTWNGTNVGTKQKMSVTINPTIAGYVNLRVFLAAASTTIYVDPVIDVGGDVSGNSRYIEGVQTFAPTAASTSTNSPRRGMPA